MILAGAMESKHFEASMEMDHSGKSFTEAWSHQNELVWAASSALFFGTPPNRPSGEIAESQHLPICLARSPPQARHKWEVTEMSRHLRGLATLPESARGIAQTKAERNWMGHCPPSSIAANNLVNNSQACKGIACNNVSG